MFFEQASLMKKKSEAGLYNKNKENIKYIRDNIENAAREGEFEIYIDQKYLNGSIIKFLKDADYEIKIDKEGTEARISWI